MTVIGKILVFVNLVFSLVTAALIVMVFSTRTNWNAQFTLLSSRFATLGASAQADVRAAEENAVAKNKLFETERLAKQELETQLRNEKAANAQVRAQLADAQKTQAGAVINLNDQTQELIRRKAEVEEAQRLRAVSEKTISEMNAKLAQHRDDVTKFRIQWEDSKARNEEFRKLNESLTREVDQLRKQLGSPAAAAVTGDLTARPPQNLRGTIQSVAGDLAVITPGSDAGIMLGAKLIVYRMQPEAKFLGYVEITRVTPHEAVGRLSGQLWKQIKAGDEVAANLLGQ